jgi:predicted TPR repeat methyltransferase
MTNGEKDLAIASYRKSVEINPRNSGGREKLKKLGGP